MRPAIAAGAGFLLAVLWFDLMFDVQSLRGRRAGGPTEDGVDSIAAYYRRVTTTARPMNLLVGAAMAGTLAAIVAQIAGGHDPAWTGWASLALAAPAVALAMLHTFPAAVRLGGRRDPPAARLRLARSIARDHLLCFPAIASVLVIQLAFA